MPGTARDRLQRMTDTREVIQVVDVSVSPSEAHDLIDAINWHRVGGRVQGKAAVPVHVWRADRARAFLFEPLGQRHIASAWEIALRRQCQAGVARWRGGPLERRPEGHGASVHTHRAAASLSSLAALIE